MYKKLNTKWRYCHCSKLGVKADYCILQYKYAEGGWRTVATCHPSSVALLSRDGVRAHTDLIKLSSGAR